MSSHAAEQTLALQEAERRHVSPSLVRTLFPPLAAESVTQRANAFPCLLLRYHGCPLSCCAGDLLHAGLAPTGIYALPCAVCYVRWNMSNWPCGHDMS
jgi:hypothetical protein